MIGEDRFLGLFTSTAYSANPADIPLLAAQDRPTSSRARAWRPAATPARRCINILATYPRDELFQTSEDDLLRTAMAILHLGERQRFRLFVRRDPFERFLSCLIYAPRENYLDRPAPEVAGDPDRRPSTARSSEFNVSLSESVLARIHITVRTTPGTIPEFDVRELEARLVAAARRWDDDLKAALVESLGEARGQRAASASSATRFPRAIARKFAARAAVPDIEMMAKLSRTRSRSA